MHAARDTRPREPSHGRNTVNLRQRRDQENGQNQKVALSLRPNVAVSWGFPCQSVGGGGIFFFVDPW
jgi:hypothetical protein